MQMQGTKCKGEELNTRWEQKIPIMMTLSPTCGCLFQPLPVSRPFWFHSQRRFRVQGCASPGRHSSHAHSRAACKERNRYRYCLLWPRSSLPFLQCDYTLLMARPLPMMLTPPCQMAKVSSEPAEMEHEGTMPGTMPETMRNHAAGEKNLIELRTGFFGVKDFFGYFGQNFGIRGAEHHKRASTRQIAETGYVLTVAARSLPAPLQCWFFRKTALPAPFWEKGCGDPRTLQGCGDRQRVRAW